MEELISRKGAKPTARALLGPRETFAASLEIALKQVDQFLTGPLQITAIVVGVADSETVFEVSLARENYSWFETQPYSLRVFKDHRCIAVTG